MADERTTLLIDVQVSASEALKRQEELKVSLQQQKEVLKQLEVEQGKTSQAYIAQEATVKNLNNQLAANGRVLTQMAGTATTASGAYAELNQRSAQAAQRAKDLAAAYGMGDERAKAAAKEAKALSDQLKEVDSSVGQNQRRVGDYAGELGKLPGVFGQVGGVVQNFAGTATTASGIAGNAFTAIKTQAISLGKAFLTLPIGAIVIVLGAILLAVNKVVDAFRKNDAAATKLQQAFSALTPISEGIAFIFDKLANVIASVALGAAKVFTAVMNLIPAFKKSAAAANELVVAQDNLEEKERQYTVNSAARNREIARLKKEAVNTQKYTDEQIAAMLKKADDLALANFEEDKKRKEEALRLIIATAKQEKDTSDKTANAIAQARAALFQSEEAYFSETLRLATKANAAAERVQKEKEDKEKAAAERAAQRLKEQKEKQEQRDKENAEWRKAQTEAEIKAFDEAQKKMIASREAALKAVNDLQFGIEEEPEVDTGSAVQYQKDLEAAKQLIRESSDLAYLDYQQELLDKEYQAAIENANKIGVDTTAIESAYVETKKKLNQAEISAKMDMASSFAGNLSEIFGKNTKIGKMAAAAQIAIDTAKGAMAAYTSTASIPVVGPALGVVAAGAVIAKGARSIKDVWAVKSGLKGDSGGGGASVSTSAASGGMPASVTGALVSRNSGQVQQAATSQAVDAALKANPVQPVLVTNDLTTALDQKVQIKSDNSL